MCVAGTNPQESGTNLLNWIDALARQHLPPCAFTESLQGNVVKGAYQHLSFDELQKFIGELAIRLQDWGEQCIANQKSCGSAIQIDGTRGWGGGKVTATPIALGPFRD